MRYLIFIIALFAAIQTNAQNNIVYGAGINYTNGAPTFTPPVRTSRVAIDTVTGRWYHFNTPGGWQLIGNTIEEIAGCTAPAYTPTKGDSKVVVNNCASPELYFYNGSAWVLISGASYLAGEGIRIENDTIILDSLNFLDFRTGSALDGDVGRVAWNDTDGTLDLKLKGGNVTLQIGQEEVSMVKHADNTGLDNGKVVYIVGSDGQNKTVRYALAASDLTSATTFGLMTESATGGNKAFCTTLGLVRNLNTSNLTEGGIVWLSADTAGAMTAVRPTAPKHGVMIGFCIRKHASQGIIFVQVQNGYELNELHDVFVPAPTNGQVLTYNTANARWQAATPANQLQTLSTDGTAGNISISSGNTITLNVNDADASATNELQTLSVAANTATLSNSGGSVTIAGAGINTVGTAGTTITVTGTEVDGSTTNELQTLSTGTNTLTLSNGGGTVTVDTDPTNDVTGSGATGQLAYWQTSQIQFGDPGLTFSAVNDRVAIGPLGSASYPLEVFRTGETGENFGLNISMANPGIRQEVKRNTGGAAFPISETRSLKLSDNTTSLLSTIGIFADFTTSPPTSSYLYISSSPVAAFNNNALRIYPSKNATLEGNFRIGDHNTPAARLHVVGSGATASTWTAQFHNSAGNNNALMIRDDGNVGIGTNAPGDRLTIRSGGNTASTTAISVRNSDNTVLFQVDDNNAVRFNTARVNSGFMTLQTNGGSNLTGFSLGSVNPFTATSDITSYISGNPRFWPTSGTGTFTYLNINANIDQTGGANGATRGIFIQPNLVNAASWRSIEWNNNTGWALYGTGTAKSYFAGNVAIGTTTQDASAAFEVSSTTQGVLFPRMTTAQRDLIATPANGLVIYNTSTDKLQVRAAGAWVDLH